MDFVRAILLQKPVAKAEEHNREAHQQRDRHHIGCARVSTDDQPIHLLLVRGKRVW
jgi:hypothetical protein